MNDPEPVAVAREQYRTSLLQLQEKMQAQYDKTVLSLSGGAFGVSVLMIKELIGAKKAIGSSSLSLAWIFWGMSVLAVLCSFFSSSHAMETAIRHIDSDKPISAEIGGLPDLWTRALNITSGSCFLVGLGFFIWFVSASL
jgi:hypothetical protein